MNTSKIGSVEIRYFNDEHDNLYLDSAVQFLYDFFDKPQSQKLIKIRKLLANNPELPIEYHPSSQREFFLRWYHFRVNTSAIKIGAGCGAVTGLLTRKLSKECPYELFQIRSEILTGRFSDAPYLKVCEGI